jgi:hypothetical protein
MSGRAGAAEREDGALMEPRGCNRWQSTANRSAPKIAKLSRIRPDHAQGEWEGQTYEDKGEVLVFDPEREIAYSHRSAMGGKPDKVCLPAPCNSPLFGVRPDRARLRRLLPDPELVRRRAAGETLRLLACDYGVAHTTWAAGSRGRRSPDSCTSYSVTYLRWRQTSRPRSGDGRAAHRPLL